MTIKERVSSLPSIPGVYLFKDGEGEIIYVGKAVNLKNRVSSYFQKSNLLPKTAALVSQIVSLDYIPVQSEIEALILEANLIKKYYPYFNIRLRDDKDYLYIKVTDEEFPRIVLARKRDIEGSLAYWGPFPDGTSVRRVVKTLRKIFPYSTCTPNAKRACFYYHIGQCLGVCVNKVNGKEYKRMIKAFIEFMNGNKEKVKKSLEKEMMTQSKYMNYEKAALLKKQMEMIDYITQPIGRVEGYIENPNLLEDIREAQLKDIAQLLHLPTIPNRIECYDISHFLGSYTSASMVVLTRGQPDKSEYRKFRIKTVKGIDDFASMREVLSRRLKNDWPLPDLIVIDGGKGQLSAAYEVLNENRKPIPVIGLAKRLEEIFVPHEKESIRLQRNDKSLQLIQLIRDEAHRFALKYHKLQRNRDFLVK